MSPFARAIGILLAITAGSQAFAHKNAVMVCRFTGKVVDPCACPHERQKASDFPTIKDQGCCELRKANFPSVPALTKATAPAPSKQLFLAWQVPQPPKINRTVFVAARQQAPPSTPLYLSIRSLLI